MRNDLALVAIALTAPCLTAFVPVAAQNAAPATAATAYSTADTPIGTLLDDPKAKAVIDKHIPGMTTDARIEMARGMTLAAVQQFAAEQVTDERLKAIDADFKALAGN